MSSAPSLRKKSGRQHLDGRCRCLRPDGARWWRRNAQHRRRQDRRGRPTSPPHGRAPSSAIAAPTRAGSEGSSAPGRPVRTLQKAQALVQVSPRIITVACRLPQHSPIFGQAASSHTVLRRWLAQDRACFVEGMRPRRSHADPIGLAQYGRIGQPRLLRMARPRLVMSGDTIACWYHLC